MCILRVYVTLLLLNVLCVQAALFTTGKVKVVIEDARRCSEFPYAPWHIAGTMRKFNRTHQAVSGNVTLDRPLDDSLAVNIEAQKWSDGGWKANALRLQKNSACTTLNEFVDQPWKTVCEAAGLHPGKCPIPKGSYSIEDLYIDGSSSRLIFMLGRFKYIVSILLKNRVLLCHEIQLLISPAM